MTAQWYSDKGSLEVCFGVLEIINLLFPELYSTDDLISDVLPFYELIGYPMTTGEWGPG